MHVFARSPADPTELFYRRREDDAYWTPWRSCPSPSRTRVSYPSCPIDA
nr:neuraminidase-like domain-containing protein [Nannocystis pusilla]